MKVESVGIESGHTDEVGHVEPSTAGMGDVGRTVQRHLPGKERRKEQTKTFTKLERELKSVQTCIKIWYNVPRTIQ